MSLETKIEEFILYMQRSQGLLKTFKVISRNQEATRTDDRSELQIINNEKLRPHHTPHTPALSASSGQSEMRRQQCNNAWSGGGLLLYDERREPLLHL
jgi:hypothetical protein